MMKLAESASLATPSLHRKEENSPALSLKMPSSYNAALNDYRQDKTVYTTLYLYMNMSDCFLFIEKPKHKLFPATDNTQNATH